MTKWQGDRKETRKLMCDLASPLKLSYIEVIVSYDIYIIYMVGKMVKNMLFIVFKLICILRVFLIKYKLSLF